MDSFSFSQLSSQPINPAQSSSDYSTTDDDVLMLASQNPKKRAGRKKFKETRHPVYRGVRSRNSGKQWVCEVRQPNNNSRMWLGTHATPEMAARAHDVAVLAMRGRSACLNFADSVWRLPVPESGSVKDIQKAAALAAGLFKQTVVELTEELSEVMFYAGEEDVFGTPEFMKSMAEGMMVPAFQTVGYADLVDDLSFCVDLSLWNF